MVILRPTRKLSSLLPATAVVPVSSDTALGDWYVNRIVVVRGLPGRLVTLVEARLKRFGIDARIIAAESQAMASVAIGPTVDRSVLGVMVDFAKAVPYHLEPGQWGESTLQIVEDQLAETPCHAARSFERVIFPEKKAPAVLRAKWLANTPLQPMIGPWTTLH